MLRDVIMDPPVPLEAVITTAALNQRPSRPADNAAVNSALIALMQEMANSPRTILQRLVDTALGLCQAHSAGISLLEDDYEIACIDLIVHYEHVNIGQGYFLRRRLVLVERRLRMATFLLRLRRDCDDGQLNSKDRPFADPVA